jgi:hypothetical protein
MSIPLSKGTWGPVHLIPSNRRFKLGPKPGDSDLKQPHEKENGNTSPCRGPIRIMETNSVSNQSHGRYLIFALLVCFSSTFPTMAGPPFHTDDPEPVDYHHWEFYGASQITRDQEGVSGTAPHVEINFGIFHETQIHMIIPLTFNHPRAGNPAYGLGDMEIGLKYRFVNETSFIPQIGIFPLIEIPTGNAETNLGHGNAQLFFPIWLQKSWGSWTTYGGGGYLFDMRPAPANSWSIGWEGQHDVSEILTLGAEVFSALFQSESSENEVGFNIGAIVNFNENHHVLFSAGRDIVGQNDLFLYAAYQYTIGPVSK